MEYNNITVIPINSLNVEPLAWQKGLLFAYKQKLYSWDNGNSRYVLRSTSLDNTEITGGSADFSDIPTDHVKSRIRNRADTYANWVANKDTVLLYGELGIEMRPDSTFMIKAGDGATDWEHLPYLNAAASPVKYKLVTGHTLPVTGWVTDVNPDTGISYARYTINSANIGSDASRIVENSQVVLRIDSIDNIRAYSKGLGQVVIEMDSVPSSPIPYTMTIMETDTAGEFFAQNSFDAGGIPLAAEGIDGLMSHTDKIKLNNISEGATRVSAGSTNGYIKIDGVDTIVFDYSRVTKSYNDLNNRPIINANLDTLTADSSDIQYNTLYKQVGESDIFESGELYIKKDLNGTPSFIKYLNSITNSEIDEIVNR